MGVMILIGTSGFSYKDWIGEFYPVGTKDGDMLRYYSVHFPAVELDFSYYTMPSIKTMAALDRKTPDKFLFSIKAHKSMTHEIDPEMAKEAFNQFRAAIAPIIDARKLGCILLQFPWGFKNTPENLDYIRRLPELLPGLPAVVEFRNKSWLVEGVFAVLQREGLGFCAVDEPRLRGLIPPVVKVTSSISYVRFHGRNAEKWWKHTEPWERYDYLYSQEELNEWLPRIKHLDAIASVTFVFFNNCHAGHAVRNALMMQASLGLPSWRPSEVDNAPST
ncbi:MAG TPA: DUF72 domain-containing protein [Firmicutes bacterium]|nr:DUF72 domain-containing protein [Bacillota bacterium]